jgi:DNA-binding XRE family transcriptional regulator
MSEEPPPRYDHEGGAVLNLRGWRNRRALSMDDLGELAGVAKSTIVAIELGRVTALKRVTMRKLAAALGVEPMDVAEFRRALMGPDGE